MKKILPLIFLFFIFLPVLLYLHQKIQVYVEAYRLSNNYRYHNQLLDKRDYLMYSFSKKVSLNKLNQWARKQHFSLINKKQMLALNKKDQNRIFKAEMPLLLKRILKVSVPASSALAKEEK